MNMPFVNTIFSELTTLGFIGLILFVVSKLDMLTSVRTGTGKTLDDNNALRTDIRKIPWREGALTRND